MISSWNLDKLKKQAIENQDFDDYILNQSGILQYDNLQVLDVGCSNGFKTKMLFDKYNHIKHVTGIDIDEKAINEAKLHFCGNDKYTFDLKSVDELGNQDRYDIIYLSYILQHLPNPKAVLKKLKAKLSDRGIIIIKVPDDSFKFCYPDSDDLLHQIFDLYESQIMIKQNITKFTDRYIGKKIYSYLKENGYQNIQLYYSIVDTVGKTPEQKLELFESSIAFRNANHKHNVSDEVKNEMNILLDKLRGKFVEDYFYYVMSVLYYVAGK